MAQETRTIFSISQLNRLTKQLLEDAFAPCWVEGEISNLSMPSSGHIYFTLKDETAQVRCAMFKHKNRQINFKLEHGLHVQVLAQVSLFEGRGDYQLIVEVMEEIGDGRLQQKFEALKKQLQAEGLFSETHKKSIPQFPKSIGIISSPTGAALRDVISVHQRRFPNIPVIIYPTAVQGKDATDQIVAAIQLANQHQQCEVLLLVRGGGSLEDLWCFNEEKVARAIFNSQIPIVSGIGHEIDFTISDFVADKRAPTPSAAAELVTPDRRELHQTFDHLYSRLHQKMQHILQTQRQRVENLKKRLRHPGDRFRELSQQIDYLEQRLSASISTRLQHELHRLTKLSARLDTQNPLHKISEFNQRIQYLEKRLFTAITTMVKQQQQRLSTLSRALDAVSPLNTLQRGFSIVTKDKAVLRNSSQVSPGDSLKIRLHEGSIIAKAETIES